MALGIFEIFVTLVGIMMGFAFYPQAYKIWKNKCVKSISVTSYLIMLFGGLTFLVYGVMLKKIPLIINYAIGDFGLIVILFFKFKYK